MFGTIEMGNLDGRGPAHCGRIRYYYPRAVMTATTSAKPPPNSQQANFDIAGLSSSLAVWPTVLVFTTETNLHAATSV